MSEKINAAQDIRNLARLYQSMNNAADMLESIGTYEQALQEAKLALETAQADLKIAQQRVKAENAKVVDAEALNERTVENVRIECDQMLKNAKSQSESILEDAHKAAEQTTKNADSVASVALLAAQDKATTLFDIIQTKNEALNVIVDQIAKAEAELLKLEQARETARQAVAKLLG